MIDLDEQEAMVTVRPGVVLLEITTVIFKDEHDLIQKFEAEDGTIDLRGLMQTHKASELPGFGHTLKTVLAQFEWCLEHHHFNFLARFAPPPTTAETENLRAVRLLVAPTV